jgi:hypothetical protein
LTCRATTDNVTAQGADAVESDCALSQRLQPNVTARSASDSATTIRNLRAISVGPPGIHCEWRLRMQPHAPKGTMNLNILYAGFDVKPLQWDIPVGFPQDLWSAGVFPERHQHHVATAPITPSSPDPLLFAGSREALNGRLAIATVHGLVDPGSASSPALDRSLQPPVANLPPSDGHQAHWCKTRLPTRSTTVGVA